MKFESILQSLTNKFILLEQIIFYLIVLFLPTQLGKHFWPDFSHVLGARLDYLSPTLYFTDVLIFILLIFNFKPLTSVILKPRLWLIFAVSLLIGIISSKSPPAGFYGLLKFLEFLFFGFYVSNRIKSYKEISVIISIFSIGILFESTLAILQFVNQSSVGGIFYFFGERTFNSQTFGIANASLNGELVLRPYGTFSHPNVLAGYLVVAMTLISSNFKSQISKLQLKFQIYEIFLGLSILVGTAALLLTMSRVAILLWIIIVGLWIMIYLKIFFKNLKFIIGLLVVLVFIGNILALSPIRYRFSDLNFSEESFVVRKDLINRSVEMIKASPVFGVGLNNYLINLSPSEKLKTQSLFTYLQPVHNIYLLIASETGLIGLSFFAWFIVKTLKKVKNPCLAGRREKSKIKKIIYPLIFIITILGFFDHYFLTLQQGQLLFSFVLGLCWTRYKI